MLSLSTFRSALGAALALTLTLAASVGCVPDVSTPTAIAVVERDAPATALSETPTPMPSSTPTTTVPTATATVLLTATSSSTPTSTPPPTPTRAAPGARPVAIVVENDPAARPQAGLLAADVVYEAVAEWYLTRLVAVFTDGAATKVGPVRSARAYNAAVAAEYQGIFAHCLDVPPVGAVIAQAKVRDYDGCRMKDPPGFDRDPSRLAPHNLYVNVSEVRGAAGGQGTYGGFARRAVWPDAATTASSVSRFNLVYPTSHPVEWRYDVSRREYLRWQDGEPHIQSDGQQVSASAVVVQQVVVSDSAYFGERGYHEITLTGQGEAAVYAAGGRRAATWKRQSIAEPTRFVGADGGEVLLPPGRVFVQLVERGTNVNEAR